MSVIYFVKRAPRSEFHLAPFHPAIICGKRAVAKWQAGSTSDAAWVWSHERGTLAGGWLLERWNGFDVDYGHIVHGITMPDGTEAAFSHQHTGRDPWPLIAGAVWWDDRKMPQCLADAGVIYAPDAFSQNAILENVHHALEEMRAKETYVERPSFWPEPAPIERFVITDGPRIPNGASIAYTEGIGCYQQKRAGTIVDLMGVVERPNGRYMDEYHILGEDGRVTVRYRPYLERMNPDAVRA